MVDIFATSANRHCSLYFSGFCDPQALGMYALLHSWDPSPGVCFPSVGLDFAGPLQAPLVIRHPDDTDSSVLASMSLVSGLCRSGSGSSDRPSSLSRSSQTVALPSSSSRDPQAVASRVETIQRFARAAGFSDSEAAQVGLARSPSSRTSYPLKWSVYRE